MYEYLVAYLYGGGHGRATLTRKTPITSKEDILEIEAELFKELEGRAVGVTSFQLLRFIE